MPLISRVVMGIFCCCFGGAMAADGIVEGVRLWAAPDNTRVVFDITDPVQHRVFRLHNPERVVIDFDAANLTGSLTGLDFSRGHISRIRSGRRGTDGLRLVLDMKKPARPKSFLLKPNSDYGHRLVLDLFDLDTPVVATKSAPKSRTDAVSSERPLRDLVIAIDAGHGGEDPGAKGPKGTREKDAVLAIANRLAALINREPGMRAVMIRTGDYYVGLRDRMRKARKYQADLMVSIHADAFQDPRVSGSSVYVVSQRGASSEMARWLADRENAADLAGGVSLDDKDDLLKTVLLDLSQAATIEASMEVAGNVLNELGGLGKTHKSDVQQAGFIVLKSPDIPSILVETAFISNPAEERRLNDLRHQEKLARSILRGVRTYFAKHAPPGTVLASREHIIRRGDTLSEIARQYDVSISALRNRNGLKSDRLQIGKVLQIPAGAGG